MGMSASQARYLGLIARQNDLEYQGQQINQERSVLSQQVSDLYATLEAMTVPTPPSTTAFTTVEYSGKIGATSYSFDASNIKPGKDGNYIVTVNQKSYGDSLQKNPAVALVENGSAGTIKLVAIATKAEKTSTSEIPGMYQDNTNGNKYMNPVSNPTAEGIGNYYVKNGSMYAKATGFQENATYYELSDAQANGGQKVGPATVEVKEGEAKIVSPENFASVYVIENGVARKATANDFELDASTGIYRFKDGVQYMEASTAGNPYNQKGALDNVSVNGHGIFELKDAVESGYITEQQKGEYEAAIANSGLTKPDGTPYSGEDFYIYFGDKGDANFVLKSDVNDGNNNAISYSYIANGEFSKPTTYDDCKLTFDASNGRITELAIPNYDKETGKVTSWTSMSVEANTKTDDLAYSDAYAKYEYNKMEYDKKQQEINAKTEVIQGMDKKLELKLQRLDNERTQITTEIEAVDKVISDNIESSYKTFA